MKKLTIVLTIVFLLLPQIAFAEWVDADKSGQEGILYYPLTSGSVSQPNLAIDSQGRPHIAFIYTSPIDVSVYYLYWNGSEWVDADGSGQESIKVKTCQGARGGNCSAISMDLDANDKAGIAVAEGSVTFVLDYLHWNGSNWTDADGSGQESMLVYISSYNPSLRFNSSNEPMVAFNIVTTIPPKSGANYLRWDNSSAAWVDADGVGQGNIEVYSPAGGTMLANSISLAVNSNNNPAVAFYASGDIFYLYWNGSAWVDANGSAGWEVISVSNSFNAVYPSLALNGNNQPRVAWRHYVGPTPTDYEVYYLEWNGSAWTDASGSGQGGINISDNSGDSGPPSLALNPADSYRPSIAWLDNSSDFNYYLYYLHWDGSSWVDAYGSSGRENIAIYKATPETSGTNYVTSRSLAFGSGPHVAWNEKYLEWLAPPSSSILPETGKDLKVLINKLLGI